jgi:hypothetical protein
MYKADELAKEYDIFMADKLGSVFTAHEISGMSALFEDRLPWENYNRLLPMANKGQTKMLNKYILNKSNWMKSDK